MKKLNDEQIEKLGRKAFDLIADYPLYAYCDGITYEEGIEVAKVIFGDIESAWQEQQDFNKKLREK